MWLKSGDGRGVRGFGGGLKISKSKNLRGYSECVGEESRDFGGWCPKFLSPKMWRGILGVCVCDRV